MTRTALVALAVVFLSAGIVQAATTISTNVSTGGTLSVTGASTLTGLTSMVQASSTRFSVHDIAYFGGTATSTFSSAGVLTAVGNTSLVTASTSGAVSIAGALWVGGNATTTAAGAISTQSTLGVTGLSTLTGGFVSQASSTVVGAVTVTGDTTLASTTATAFKVGQTGTRMTAAVTGYCTFTDVTLAASSTAGFADCTAVPAGVLVSGDRVFVQATSSFEAPFIITAASTTGVSTIQLRILNTGLGTADGTLSGTSVNFWAVR